MELPGESGTESGTPAPRGNAERRAGVALSSLAGLACCFGATLAIAGGDAGGGAGEVARAAALCGAFQVAFLEFGALGGRPQDGPRFALGLALGACWCHAGWVALHAVDASSAARMLSQTAGFTVLLLPLGPVCCAPRARVRRAEFLRCALGSLPLAVAAARVGCVAAGCCGGVDHPTQLYEAIACAGLAFAVRRVPKRLVACFAVGGLAAARLAVEPLRAVPALGAPNVPVELVAGSMLVVCAWAARREISR